MQVAVILADNEIDLICDWDSHAADHIADLRNSGHVVKRRLFPSWPAAEAFEDHFNGNTGGGLWIEETSADDPEDVVSNIKRFGTLGD
jgi:hypothetical protein